MHIPIMNPGCFIKAGVEWSEVFTANKISCFLWWTVRWSSFVKLWNKDKWMEASDPKWVNPYYIQYGVNSLRLEGLHIILGLSSLSSKKNCQNRHNLYQELLNHNNFFLNNELGV